MKWLNPHSICFAVGFILTVVGISAIYRPAAAVTAGLILMAVSTLGGDKEAKP